MLYELINNKIDFKIYNTSKGTQILILDNYEYRGTVFYPKYDKLPWKIEEGKKINTCIEVVFSSGKNSIEELNTEKWNNGNQIMCYENYYNIHYKIN